MRLFYTNQQIIYLSSCLPRDYKLIASEEYHFDSSEDEGISSQQSQQSLKVQEYQTIIQFIFVKLKLSQWFIQLAVKSETYHLLQELEIRIQSDDIQLEDFQNIIFQIMGKDDQSKILQSYFRHLVDALYHANTLIKLKESNSIKAQIKDTEQIVNYKEDIFSVKLNHKDKHQIINCVKKLSKRRYRRAFDLLKGKQCKKLKLRMKRIPDITFTKLMKLTNYIPQTNDVQAVDFTRQVLFVEDQAEFIQTKEVEEEPKQVSSETDDSFTSDDDSL